MVFASFVVAVGAYFDLLSMDDDDRAHVETLFSWVPGRSLQIDMAFLADPLSIAMCLFVTGIGVLIHLFAIGYMHGDPKFSKFFLYLNLFVLSMTLLVLGENLLVTFLGWEGVGTCSYLLISFWHQRESAATAGKKAFVTNRIGDWGFMLAMFLGFAASGRSATATSTRPPRPARSPSPPPPASPCCCSSAPSASRPSCRSTSGCPTPWRARPRCRP